LNTSRRSYGNENDIVIVSPDAGGVERARAFAKRLSASLAIIDKRRLAPNVAEVMNIIGTVEGKTAILLDDMVDTAGTLAQSADALRRKGAKHVYAAHPRSPVGPGHRALENRRSRNSCDQHVPLVPRRRAKTLHVLTVAPLLARPSRGSISRIRSARCSV